MAGDAGDEAVAVKKEVRFEEHQRNWTTTAQEPNANYVHPYSPPRIRDLAISLALLVAGCAVKGFGATLVALYVLAALLFVVNDHDVLLAAVAGNDTKVATLLKVFDAKRGGAVGVFGVVAFRSALVAAAMEGHASMVKLLLEAGADPQQGITVGPAGCLMSETCLCAPADKGHAAVVELLLKAGADPQQGLKAGPRGSLGSMSPLHAAAKNGHAAVVELLLKAGADPSKGAAWGPFGFFGTESPLRAAQKNGHEAAVKALRV